MVSPGHICYIGQKRKKMSWTTKRNGKMENDDRLDINWIDIENPSRVYGNVTNKNIPDKEWPSSHEDVYGLKTALLTACNPARFMEPDYDVNKVSAAIEIYKKLKEVAPYDMETLGILRKDAEKALNIRLDTNAFYHHLIKMFSPKRYVVNYQEDLLTKSHEICSRLTENKDSMQGMENVLKEVEFSSRFKGMNVSNITRMDTDSRSGLIAIIVAMVLIATGGIMISIAYINY